MSLISIILYNMEEVSTLEIRITLSEEEHLAARTVMADPQEWAENAIRNRANIAANDVVQKYVSVAIENNWTIPNTRIEIIKAAISKGVFRIEKPDTPPEGLL